MRKIRISPINLLWAFLFGFVSVWAQEPAPEDAGEGVDTVVGEPVRESVLDVLSEGDVSGEDAPEGESGSQSNVGGLRGILDILTPEEQPGAAESVSEEKRTEQDKKINELRRSASSSIVKGRVDVAIASLNELISMKPYDPDYHLSVGLCYRQKGRHKEALEKYEDVLDLGGDRALVALLRAESFTIQGKRGKAFESLRESAVLGRNIINDTRSLKALQQFQDDTEFIKLALSLEKVPVDVAKIKDPFTNPFPTVNPNEDQVVDAREEPLYLEPEQQEGLLEKAKHTFERVKFFIKIEDESKAMTAYLQLDKLIQQKALLTIPKIVSEFNTLIAKMPAVETEIEGIRLKYYYRQAQDKLRQMKEIFVDGEYDRVRKIHHEVIRLTEDMKSTNKSYAAVADRIVQASNLWSDRANIRKDFEGLRPQIQGIIISDEGKMAVLNDRVVKEGEFFDDLRVVKIESNKVAFRYKGEEIPIVFRRY